MAQNTIAIAGFGWLGKPFGQHLMMLGYRVKASATSAKKATGLQQKGIDAYHLQITEDGVLGSSKGFLKDVAALVVMIPPGLRGTTGTDYVLKMTHFLTEIKNSKVTNCIFVSSTSVYGDNQGKVTEKQLPIPETEAGRQLSQVEQLFFNSEINTSIVRFGGLFGGNRQPVTYLSGREGLSNGKAPVNMIHRKDCIAILTKIIKQKAYGHIFNAVHPSHPFKEDYYTTKAIALGIDPPTYAKSDTTSEIYKQVDSVNLELVLGFQFKNEL